MTMQAQSYYSVILRGRFNIYEMRIMLKIVQRTRVLTDGRWNDLLKRRIDTSSLSLDYAIPVAELIGGKSHNYEPIKDAARAMKAWQIEFYEKERRIWHLASMIENVELDERAGILRFSTPKWLVDYMVDFRNGGYRSYDFEIAMSMRNPYAARFYLLTCSQTDDIYMQLDSFKKVLGIEGRYPKFYDFERRVLQPAMRELERRGVNGFVYREQREFKDNPRSAVKGVWIHPIKRGKKERNISEIVGEIKRDLPELFTQYLMIQWKFTSIEMANNKKTFLAFTSLEDWQNALIEISDRARRKRKGHGYLIEGMKGKIAEQEARK